VPQITDAFLAADISRTKRTEGVGKRCVPARVIVFPLCQSCHRLSGGESDTQTDRPTEDRQSGCARSPERPPALPSPSDVVAGRFADAWASATDGDGHVRRQAAEINR